MKPSIKILCLLVIAIDVVNFFAVATTNSSTPFNGWRGISLAITHLATMAAMFYWFPKMLFRGQADERTRKEKDVRTSGLLKTHFSCHGKIGALYFSAPLLYITVYPQGIHFRPFLVPAFGILENEIKSVQIHKTFFKRGVEITHASPEIVSPIFLSCANNSVAVAALTAFTAQPSPFS